MRSAALSAALAVTGLATPALAADSLVSDTRSAEAFTAAFCAADRLTQHIFVLPTAAFSDGGRVACPHGTSGMRVAVPADDPGHLVLNIDPPDGVADGFDCDGKADEGMSLVAINCLPANLETADHQ
ncbi:MAG: hypothetical protein AAGE90_04255 [Pseudomonadota bacterium]